MFKKIAIFSLALSAGVASAATLKVELLSGPHESGLKPSMVSVIQSAPGQPFVLKNTHSHAYISRVDLVDGATKLTPSEIETGLSLTATPDNNGAFLVDANISELAMTNLPLLKVEAPCSSAPDGKDPKGGCFNVGGMDQPTTSQWSLRQKVSFENDKVAVFDRQVPGSGMQRLRLTLQP